MKINTSAWLFAIATTAVVPDAAAGESSTRFNLLRNLKDKNANKGANKGGVSAGVANENSDGGMESAGLVEVIVGTPPDAPEDAVNVGNETGSVVIESESDLETVDLAALGVDTTDPSQGMEGEVLTTKGTEPVRQNMVKKQEVEAEEEAAATSRRRWRRGLEVVNEADIIPDTNTTNTTSPGTDETQDTYLDNVDDEYIMTEPDEEDFPEINIDDIDGFLEENGFLIDDGNITGNETSSLIDEGTGEVEARGIIERVRRGLSDVKENALRRLTREAKEAIVEEYSQNKRRLQPHRKLADITTHQIGDFAPLSCNADLATAVCDGNSFKALVDAAASTSSEVVVPCGTCYTYDLPPGPNTIAGLNIIGKLHVPTNYKSELRTPYIFLQGELDMSDTNVISEENASMTISLIDNGTLPPNFTPADSNANVAGTPFDVGIKAFLVAGGKLNIRGWDGDSTEGGAIESWTPMLGEATGAPPNPPLSTTPGEERYMVDAPVNTKDGSVCERKLIHHTFDPMTEHHMWSGGDGKVIEHVDGTIVLKDIDVNWQGFKLDFTEQAKECPFIDEATYLVTARIKIDLPGSEGQKTQCEIDGSDCFRLLRKIMRSTPDERWFGEKNRYEDRWIDRGEIGRYGEWFTFSTEWKWKSSELELGDDIVGNLFIFERFPIGSTIHLDEFTLELPSEKSYADPANACAELAINGDAEDTDGSGYNYYPFYSHGSRPVIMEEEVTTDAGTSINKFYRNDGRRYTDWSQRFRPNLDCFVKDYMYTMSLRVRVVEGPDLSYYIRIYGTDAVGNRHYIDKLRCPTQGVADGWVECSTPLLIDERLASLTYAQWEFRASSTAVVDMDDISIAYTKGPAEGLSLNANEAKRWGPGADVHITSTTLDWRDSQDAVIQEVIPNGATVNVKLTSGIAGVLTEEQTPGMGAEVAILSRNIKIDGGFDFEKCGSERFKQTDYRGTTATAASGAVCQAWAGSAHSPEVYADADLSSNYCRNPYPNRMHRAWCYVNGAREYCDVDYCSGGYVQVLHTPDVAQVVEGVEFSNMGQQGAKNRFPLQFLYTKAVAGTSVARNSIRNSEHRCISLDGVSEATIASNVAHDIAGHCYYIGFEATSNLLLNNLGSRTNDLIKRGEAVRHYNDHDTATFFFQNPQNDFIGNVAAGSARRGWEAAMHWTTYGEDHTYRGRLIGTTEGMRRRALGTFRNNKAHSNWWQGFRLHHFEQFFKFRNDVDVPTFENTSAYRNREHGIYSYNVIAAKWLGGSLSDNQWGLVLREADGITVENFDIVGSSEAVREHTVSRRLKLCSYGHWDHDGIHMMTAVWRHGHLDPNRGIRFKNVNISGLDKEKTWYPYCRTTNPISFSGSRLDGHFDYTSSLQGVNIDDSRGVVMDGCRPNTWAPNAVKDIVFTDIDGGLDPTGTSTPGSLVSNFDHMKGLLSDCTSMENSCMAYCKNACLRTVSYNVEQFGTENWSLKITDTSVENGESFLIPSTIRTINDHYFSVAYASRKFSASLPAGSYTVSFVNESGETVWPQYAEEFWAEEPDCNGYVTQEMITLDEPTVDADFCEELIRNGGQEPLTTTEPWLHNFFDWRHPRDVQVQAGLGLDGSDAIVSHMRSRYWTGIGQNIDSRCLQMMKGEMYEFEAQMKVTNSADHQSIATVDPNSNLPTYVTINGRRYRDVSTKKHIYTFEEHDKAHMTRPYDASGGWNTVHGIFRIPDTHRAFFEIERSPDYKDFLVNEASLKKMSCNPDQLLLNGDVETGTSKYWDTWGHTVKLDIVPGYPDGSGNALKSFNRPHLSHGQAQIINTDCVTEEGGRLAFSARIKFEQGGVHQRCNPFSWSSDRCSDIWMHTNKAGKREYHRVALITTEDEYDSENGWYHIHGLWNLRPNQYQAGFNKIYFDGISTAYDVVVDNAEIKHLPQQCSNLVENPSFTDGSLYWHLSDRNRAKASLYSPGADGGSDLALRVYDRDHQWRGVRQLLDRRCFAIGEDYTISAKFRMLNSTTGEGVMCDENTRHTWSGNQCPQVAIYGHRCDGGNVYLRYWNALSGFNWDPDTFNDFGAEFKYNAQLATCEYVYVYLHEVNRAVELIVDDVQISSKQTLAPSTSPTPPPIDEIIEVVTEGPTASPTSMPTVSAITSCPTAEFDPTELPAGPVMLARTATLCILTKATTAVDGTLTNIAPVALSYDGGDWEKAAGEFATNLLYGMEFGDYTDGSHITLPELNEGEKYYLTTYSHSLAEPVGDELNPKVARLLEAGTFGTTHADLLAWSGTDLTTETAKQWIQSQIDAPMTSHRDYYRKRTNPRLNTPIRPARPDHPCDANSRWRKYAFSRKDGDLRWYKNQFEAVSNNGANYITIKLNGHVRTVVNSLAFAEGAAYALNTSGMVYEMCHLPAEYEGGNFHLRVNVTSRACQSLPNPLVQFYEDSDQPMNVLSLPSISPGVLEQIDVDRSRGGDYILRNGLDDALCSQLSDVTEESDAPVFGQLPDGSWLQWDPFMILEENTVDSPLPDGGGLVRSLSGEQTKCSSAPRTFLNEDNCFLSDSMHACGSAGTPALTIDLNTDNIHELHSISGQYVYAILGLPVRDFYNATLPSPCELGLRSRWEILDAAECPNPTTLGSATNKTLVELLIQKGNSDLNPLLRDIYFPTRGKSCNQTDIDNLVEVEIVIDSQCFRRVHPEHMSVFDFTYWTLNNTHPGNMMAMMHDHPNPIKKWRDIDASAFITYPSFPPPGHDSHLVPHSLKRWDTHSPMFEKLGRFGDAVKFVDLPNEIRLDEVAQHYGAATEVGGGGVVVCGSPDESSNDITLGQLFEFRHRKATAWGTERQREHIWTQIALGAPDQLRQRVAWSLAQLLVIARGAIGVGSHTEPWVGYYDIFVRNAFGNYRDVLREISYSPLMAENLSYLQSKSAAYTWEFQGKISFADENFAREIMQLFSTGMAKLNLDGTPILDEYGNPQLAYTNDEIMSFARVWTGFDYQQGRGNVEEESWSGNRHDPMKIQAGWRDKFPKTDMTGGYIGDGYPLCVDLPDKMFLSKGASYRLLGTSFMPELMEDNSSFKTDPTLKKFVLDANSELKAALCNADGSGNCQYENTVTLGSTLTCSSSECNADTVRVVQVNDVHYEYVRPACVEQTFYANAKKVINRERWSDSSCANPLLPYASEACCEGQHDIRAERSPDYLYDQERVMYSTAGSRCAAMNMESCDFNDITGIARHKKGYHWTTANCVIQVKVNEIGQVALVYDPESYQYLHPHVRLDNRNYFKVYWDGDYPKNDNDVTVGNTCGNDACESLPTGGCLCGTTITETAVFDKMPSSVEEVLSELTIGAFDPSAYSSGTYEAPVTTNGVTAYLSAASGAFDTKTVFEVTDDYGRLFRFKNTYERVRIQGASEFAFRNAPSFMSVLNSEADARDAYYETEAALDHYFYHDNTAPFIAYRMIQKFTTSNPKPRYVAAVASAFRSGSYEGIGSGSYGDLAATIAAVLLDKEAQSVNLDADPFKGNLREPLLRVMALMRGMELQLAEDEQIVKMDYLNNRIGMMAHNFPTVFSFMLPEYVPGGRPGEATLVGPETMIMDMPKVVGLLNGMFSLVKYGVSRCHGGFSNQHTGHCSEGNYANSPAYLSFSRPYVAPAEGSRRLSEDAHAESVVKELSTILTSGRLSDDNKAVIKAAYLAKLSDTTLSDPSGAALRVAQQLIITSPEFHTTNTVRSAGAVREQPTPPQASGAPYKAIVYVMFGGGCDSYNMLVPYTCSGPKDMWAEYTEIRQEIALDKNNVNVLNNVTDQVCETFAVHPQLDSVAQMFNDGDLMFFANTGGMTKMTDRENYWRDTEQGLFAHNLMQLAAMRVDPMKAKDGTGVLGRIRDVLTTEANLNVGAFSIDQNSISLIGEPGKTASPMILSNGGVTTFNPYPSSTDMDAAIASINGQTTSESGVFGEFYSDTLVKSLAHNQLLYDTLAEKTTITTFPNSHLGRQLSMVAKMIDSRGVRGTDADLFYLSTGGWDTHSQVLMNQERLFANVDASFHAFAEELKATGVWDSVTLVQVSDFARTLTQNGGKGSDHAWGGNYIMFGGGVKGGQIAGKYPDGIVHGSPLNIGRGRIIPTTSWDAVFLPLAEWAGISSAHFDYIAPNRNNFPDSHFFQAADLFEMTP